jgi:hypothetical protein
MNFDSYRNIHILIIIYSLKQKRMPIDENGTPGMAGVNPTNPTTNWQQPWAISDLGDILMDKSLDAIQKNDFVWVTKNDVADLGEGEEDYDPFAKPTSISESIDTSIPKVENHATIEDLQNIMLDSPTSESPFLDTKPTIVGDIPVVEENNAVTEDVTEISDIAKTVNEEDTIWESIEDTTTDPLDIDLGDLEGESEVSGEKLVNEDVSVIEDITPVIEDVVSVPVVENSPETPTVETNEEVAVDPLSFDLGDLGGESEVNSEENIVDETTISVETPVSEKDSIGEDVENTTTDPLDIDLGGIEEPVVEDIAPVIETIESTPIEMSVDEEGIIGDISSQTPIVENNITSETGETPVDQVDIIDNSQSIVVHTPFIETVPQVVNALDALQSTVQTEIPSVPETAPLVPTNPENTVLEKVAEDVTQGIDLDSLMVDSPAVAASAQIADQQTATQTPTEWLKAMFAGSNGKQKKLLIWLGWVCLLWLIFFGYKLISDSSPVAPTPVINTEITWDIATSTSGDIANGDIVPDEVVNTTTGENTTWDTVSNTSNLDTNTWSTTNIQTSKTPAELLISTKDLAWKVRKALIKATIMKNSEVRLAAFTLQKDIEAVMQKLENTTDITTVWDSETTVNTLSQRLDSILQQLNGNSQ